MKLVIVTSVEEYHDDILDIFKKSNIESFSESENIESNSPIKAIVLPIEKYL